MTTYIWLWGLLSIHQALHTVSQFMASPGLPFPFPPQMPDGSPMPPMPPLPPMPMQASPQLPMSMPMSMHQPRLPMVVMPYYSKNGKPLTKYRKKKRQSPKRHVHESSSDSDGSDSASNEFEFRVKKHLKKGRQVLIPVVSYVTKDGYVVYQKKIKKEKAKDWLEIGKKKIFGSQEVSGERLEDVKRRLRYAKKRNHNE